MNAATAQKSGTRANVGTAVAKTVPGTNKNKEVAQSQVNTVEAMEVSSIPRRQTFARFVTAFLFRLEQSKIGLRNLIVGGNGSHPRIGEHHEREIQAIYTEMVTVDFQLSHEDLVLMRAVKDDCRLGVTDRFYEACRILDVLLPRFKDRPEGTTDVPFAAPLEGEPILSWEQITEMFVNENPAYIRKRISQICLEENTSILPLPEGMEIDDLETCEGLWLVNQNSNEGVVLSAALNYNQAELRAANMPRFTYIARAMGALREITETVPSSRNQTMQYVTGAGNALFTYFTTQREDETDIEAIDLFGNYRNFRTNLGWHRESAVSIITRLNNGKPAYKDLLNLAKRYRGIHYWGLEALIRQTVPLMKGMFEAPESREEVIKWLKNCGVLESYQKHKRFHVKMG